MHRLKLMPLWLLSLLALLSPLSACGTTPEFQTRRLPTELLAPCLSLNALDPTAQQRALAVEVLQNTPDQIACRKGAEQVIAAERAQ